MMIIYIYKEIYEIYKNYLDSIVSNFNFSIKIYIINNENDNKFYDIIDNNLVNIFFININESIVKKIYNLNKNFYLFNIKKLNFNDDLSYLKNYNIRIIDYNNSNIYIFKKNTNNLIYIPLKIDDKYIFSYKKTYDVAIYNINNEYKKHLAEEFKKYNVKITNINLCNKNDMFNILFKHKIFINFDDEDNNGLLNEYICNKCIYNRVIIINNKSLSNNNNKFNNLIFDINYDLISSFGNYILSNYEHILNNIYEKNNYLINTYKFKDNELFLKEFNNLKNNIFNDTSSNTVIDTSSNTVVDTSSNTVIDTVIDTSSNIISNNVSDTMSDIVNKDINNTFGFIIIRYVNSEESNMYWIESYRSIRKFYNNKIIIIDDNSNNDFVKCDIELINYDIINSEFPQSGELLGYYYFYTYHFFEKAIIIHDSVFINNYIHFENYKDIKFLWHFTHHWDNENEELFLLKKIKNQDLIDLHFKKDDWYGCYGLQSVIEYNFLNKIVNKYDIFILLKDISTRDSRMHIERVLAVIFTNECSELKTNPSIYGIIHHYIHWGYSYESYLEDRLTEKNKNLDIIKVWCGR